MSKLPESMSELQTQKILEMDGDCIGDQMLCQGLVQYFAKLEAAELEEAHHGWMPLDAL